LFRGKDKTTDVLSFSYGEGSGFPSDSKGLGDIVISLPKVRRQARDNAHTVKEEFALMVVHGTLHLLGYDHEKVRDEKVMFGIQDKVLRKVLKGS
ncbi:MAG: rRNA maturation RNase YbeY, partial [Patescibacteria group bacterium]